MKVQIKRFALHQNAKVFGVLMGLSSLVFAVPAFIIFSAVAVPAGHKGPPAFMFLLFPLMYLVMGYIMVAIGCALYNFVSRYTGGIEYETESTDA
jgi:hypothetical protein